jgi:hypothetical protein
MSIFFDRLAMGVAESVYELKNTFALTTRVEGNTKG